MMLDIDKALAASQVAISARPIVATGEVSKRFSLPLPITEPFSLRHESSKYWSVTKSIYGWYTARYGDKLKVDPKIGRMAIQIEDDLWALIFPVMFGQGNITAERGKKSQNDMKKGSIVYNIEDAIEGMTKNRIESLSDIERIQLFQKFMLGFLAFGVLDGSPKHVLIDLAKADIQSAVDNLVGRNPQYGLSKWSSLQAAEKVFKAAIEMSGGRYSNTHNLTKLAEQAAQVGISADWTKLISAIQCEPGIRYAEKPCCRNEALDAHQSSLELISTIASSGSKLRSNLALQPTRPASGRPGG